MLRVNEGAKGLLDGSKPSAFRSDRLNLWEGFGGGTVGGRFFEEGTVGFMEF